MLGSFDRCKYMNLWMNIRMNIWGMLILRMNICECMNECKNEYMENVNVRSECGNERMLGVNVLIGAMLGVNVGMGEC